MAVITFDSAAFRIQCPVYSDPTNYPDATLQDYWDMAINFVSDEDYGYLTGGARRMAINYMLAHLLYITALILDGTTPGTVINSTVDRTSVALQAPKERSSFMFWMNQSPYGVALLALLRVNAVGGYLVGSSNPRANIRQPDGGFL